VHLSPLGKQRHTQQWSSYWNIQALPAALKRPPHGGWNAARRLAGFDAARVPQLCCAGEVGRSVGQLPAAGPLGVQPNPKAAAGGVAVSSTRAPASPLWQRCGTASTAAFCWLCQQVRGAIATAVVSREVGRLRRCIAYRSVGSSKRAIQSDRF